MSSPSLSAAPQVRLLLILSLAHFLIDFPGGAIPALNPYFRAEYQLSYTQVGILMFVLSLFNALVQPFSAMYTDRTRNGRLIPFSLLAVAVGFYGVSQTGRFETLLVFISLMGLGSALYHPEGMRAANLLAGERQSSRMAIFQVGGNVGFGVGPALAVGVVSWLGLRGLGWLAVAPALCALGMFILLPRMRSVWEAEYRARSGDLGRGVPGRAESDWAARTGKTGESEASSPLGSNGPLRDRWDGTAFLLLMVFSRSAFQLALATYFPLYFVEVRGGAEDQVGWILALFLLSGAVGTLVGGPIADQIGPRMYLRVALLLLIPLHLLMMISDGWWMVLFLSLEGFVMISTMAVSIVLGQSYLPSRLALAGALNVSVGMGLGGLITALFGMFADHYGLTATLFSVLGLVVIGSFFALKLPPTDAEYRSEKVSEA